MFSPIFGQLQRRKQVLNVHNDTHGSNCCGYWKAAAHHRDSQVPPTLCRYQVSSQAAIVMSLHESVHSNLDKYDLEIHLHGRKRLAIC